MRLRKYLGAIAATIILTPVLAFAHAVPASASGPCTPPVTNPIVCENSLPGTPVSDFAVTGAGDLTIQGFATDVSVAAGTTIHFKINTPATAYHIDIYRLGYYGGDGARLVAANVQPTASLPQTQPPCLTDASTGLVDCGNWAESAHWDVPSTMVSGVFIAHLVRDDVDNDDGSQIEFDVRNDASHSDILVQTSDAEREAYNQYGGNSLYFCGTCNARAAYKVSFNRPGTAAAVGPYYSIFSFEAQLISWLEENGYNVSYQSDVDTDRLGASVIEQHKLFVSSGHDEYWSGAQRSNVEAARDAGVNLAFFSGNEIAWKIRYEPAIDGSGTAYRTEVSYKETYGDAHDPADPPVSTAAWEDPRFGAPADGGKPQNALTGQLYRVDGPTTYPLQVPAADGKMRFWRDTSVATLAPGTTATLADDTLGFEWDEDVDNGYRPAGLFDLSTTTEQTTSLADLNFSTKEESGTATHHLTLYRAPSGALVFGAGTVQWSWGLVGSPDGSIPSDPNMQQATVNLLADMGVQPSTIQSGLVATSASTDTTPPVSTITSPAPGANIANGSVVTISGTATDVGGQVAGVEVSTDGGTTWHPATGRANWTYSWGVQAAGNVTILSRAVDDSGNLEKPGPGVSVTAGCPCQLFPNNSAPQTSSGSDTSSVELGTRFTTDSNGYITALRFYKDPASTGTHIGSLWSVGGTLLGQVTFTNETASGWQQAALPSPVPVTAGTTYVASYHTQSYASTEWAFAATGHVDSGPLHAPSDTPGAPNGVYKYGSSPVFPTSTYDSSNYFVSPVYVSSLGPASVPGAPSGVSAVGGDASATVSWTAPAANGSPISSYSVTPFVGSVAQSAVVVSGSPPATSTVVTGLSNGTSYTFEVSATNGVGTGPLSGASNVVTPAGASCPCALWASSAVPGTVDDGDGGASVELGVKFSASADGYVTGVRFYKSAANTGTHTGSLWSSSGSLLATATFTSESASGWQDVSFSSPVAVTAGTTYVASYHTSAGHYSFDNQYFASEWDQGVLSAPSSSASGGNGVYRYGTSSFPTSTFGAGNYWVSPDYVPA